MPLFFEGAGLVVMCSFCHVTRDDFPRAIFMVFVTVILWLNSLYISRLMT